MPLSNRKDLYELNIDSINCIRDVSSQNDMYNSCIVCLFGISGDSITTKYEQENTAIAIWNRLHINLPVGYYQLAFSSSYDGLNGLKTVLDNINMASGKCDDICKYSCDIFEGSYCSVYFYTYIYKYIYTCIIMYYHQ